MLNLNRLARLIVLVFATVNFLLLINQPAVASRLGIWPINPVIEFEQKNSKVVVNNLDPTHAVRLQIKVMQWEQLNGEDVLSEQKDIVISPPLIEVKPGAEQLFRIIVKNPMPNLAHEKSYRLLIDDVPIPNSIALEPINISLRMSYSLPLIVKHQKVTPKASDLKNTINSQIKFTLNNSTPPQITLKNESQWVQRMTKVMIIDSNNNVLDTLTEGLWGYTLPNGIKTFSITKSQFDLLNKQENTLVYTFDEQEFRITKQ